ncbi:HAD-like domain-containing protein [Pilobolus umbonatus]|nr:HAD-like domain-containing protein [Pilobolus umbonatus]
MPFVIFSIEDTLYTVDGIIQCMDDIFKSKDNTITIQQVKHFYDVWHNTALRDYMASSHAGKYRTLLSILKAILPRTCLSEGYLPLTETEEDRIMRCFQDRSIDPQALEALKLLGNEWHVWFLSAGSYSDTTQFIQQNDLRSYVGENILCCDDLKVSKPHPKVYSEIMRMAVHRTKRIENFYIVGAYAHDLAGAQNVSLRTVFLNRVEHVYPHELYGNRPDREGHDIIDCVHQIIHYEKQGLNGTLNSPQ